MSNDPSWPYWILEDGVPVKTDIRTWGEWFQTADRTIVRTQLDGAYVSTVFTGMGFQTSGPPLLYETMSFADPDADYVLENCGPWPSGSEEEARRVHKTVCEELALELKRYHDHMRELREQEEQRDQWLQNKKRILKWRKKPSTK